MIGSGEAAIQYPPHWLTKASPSDLAALGITWEADAPKVRPPKPLDDVKKELKDAISVQAENIRLQYVTAGSGKAMSYQEKLAEARLVLDDTAAAAALTAQEQQDTYPILASEIGVTAKGEVRHTKETQTVKEALSPFAKQAISELALKVEELEKKLQRSERAINIIIEAAKEHAAEKGKPGP
ncbi:MAG: hypothetical protein EB168_03220 [Euryarchaeota archaeon]|nr:hypothetical protein [Euryarchaeota archaeon]